MRHDLIDARWLPLAVFHPFRLGAVRFNRGTLPRQACIAVLKIAAKIWKGKLTRQLKEVRPLDRPDLGFEATDSMVMEAVFWFGVQGYEGMVADAWTQHCRRSHSILEIGGNVGLFSVIGGLATSGRYTVLEPLPAVAAILVENLRRNRAERVEVLRAAAIPGATGSTVRIQVPDADRGAPVGAHLSMDSEVSGRPIAAQFDVPGLPFRDLCTGRDLIKIDAEGIEAALIESAWDIVVQDRPTLLIEVLPESTQLGALLARLATEARYHIQVLPEWGSETAVIIAPEEFDATVPQRHRSKDVLLTTIEADSTAAGAAIDARHDRC
jgi:FkbM family methyltransferase